MCSPGPLLRKVMYPGTVDGSGRERATASNPKPILTAENCLTGSAPSWESLHPETEPGKYFVFPFWSNVRQSDKLLSGLVETSPSLSPTLHIFLLLSQASIPKKHLVF